MPVDSACIANSTANESMEKTKGLEARVKALEERMNTLLQLELERRLYGALSHGGSPTDV